MAFFEMFAANMFTPLMDIIRHASEIGQLPETLEQAPIIVMLKQTEDPSLCGSYRPIAVLSSKYKVFTKFKATKLETVIPNFINTDQTGFICNHFSFENFRRFLNKINCA